MKKCTKCGRDNLDDVLFCGYCAERLPAKDTANLFNGMNKVHETILTFYPLHKGFRLPWTARHKPISDENFEIEEKNGEYVLKNNKGTDDEFVISEGSTICEDFNHAILHCFCVKRHDSSTLQIGKYL